MELYKIGYARVSSAGQDLDIQKQALLKEGCAEDKIFTEKMSASTLQKRGALENALSHLRNENDALVVTRIDRLARSMFDLLKIYERIQKTNSKLIVTEQRNEFNTIEGQLLFKLLGVFAEFENNIRKERQFEGIKKAKADGVKFGRRPILSQQQRQDIKRLRNEEDFSLRQLMDKYACSKRTLYRILNEA